MRNNSQRLKRRPDTILLETSEAVLVLPPGAMLPPSSKIPPHIRCDLLSKRDLKLTCRVDLQGVYVWYPDYREEKLFTWAEVHQIAADQGANLILSH